MQALGDRSKTRATVRIAVLSAFLSMLPVGMAIGGKTTLTGANPSQSGESTRMQSRNFVLGLGSGVARQRSGTRGPSDEVEAESLGGGASADDSEELGILEYSRLSAFALVDAAETDRDRTARGRGFGQHTYSATVGADYRISESLFAGATASYALGETDIDGDVATHDLDLFVLGVHGAKYWANDMFVEWLASYGSLGLDIERFDGVGNFTADTDGDQWSLDLSLGYEDTYKRWRFTPIVKGVLVRGDIDGYREQRVGSSGTPKEVNGQDFDSTVLDFSLQADYVVLTEWGVLVPSVKVAVRREYESATPMTGRNPSTGNAFSERPDDPDDNTMLARAGVSAQFQYGWSAFASYEYLHGHTFLDRYKVALGVRYEIPKY